MVFSIWPSRPVLRHERVPVLPAGSTEIRILHISDLHLTPREGRAIAWLRSLAALEPDLVISTGDHLASEDAVPLVLTALEGLLEKPGAFVLGSNDYFAPVLKSPHHYLTDRRQGDHTPRGARALHWQDLVGAMRARGWIDLTHRREHLSINGTTIELRGTDDAHLGRDDYSTISGRPDAPLAIGVTHAPYLRLLHAMANDGVDLIFAGHTHGGQWRLPWPGGSRALVTNCDLPTRQARGLSRVDAAWLHVSAGVGASPFTPLRIACPPEATLLTLVPA
jgi:predicted MPP superfamily phosphohydrolase